MGSVADDGAVLEDDDVVGVDDRRDPLGHDDDRRMPGDRLECRPEPCVRRQVEGREAVIEEIDVGLRDERPGDGESLALTAGDVGAPLGDR